MNERRATAEWRRVCHADTGQVLVERARWADGFWSELRGLTFRRSLPADEGLILVEDHAGRANTSIHMFFVFFPIAAIWIAEDGTVVDQKLARPFRPAYVPARPARYVLEADPEVLNRVRPGDHVVFESIHE